ncbi:MAG: glycosyltransferase [Candidatus Methylomirabilota bacterium]
MVGIDRPIRVARVIARLNVGGPARHTVLLAAGMDPRRFATTLITGRVEPDEGDFGFLAAERGVVPVTIPELSRALHPGRDLAVLVKLVRLFRRLAPDIVHTHTAKAGALGRVAALLAGVPVRIHTFHGHVLDGYFSPPVSRLFLAVERGLARRTDRIVILGPRLRAAMLALGIGRPDQYAVIPLGLELARFRSVRRDPLSLRATLGVPAGAPLLGSIGRLVPIKDHPTLFRALAAVPAGPAAPHLAVVGDGECRGELERLAEALGIGARIHFLGWRHDLEAILAGCDVVISSSRNEGTPVALIEAMAAGVPVLATDVGGVGDLVADGETGWLVPPADPGAMAARLQTLLADRAGAERAAARARDAVFARHDAPGLIRRMEALYDEVIAEKRGV